MTLQTIVLIGLAILVLGRGNLQQGVQRLIGHIADGVWHKPKGTLGTLPAIAIALVFWVGVFQAANVFTGGSLGSATFIMAVVILAAFAFIRYWTKPGKRAEDLPRRRH